MIIKDIEYTESYIKIIFDSGEHVRVEHTAIPQALLQKGTPIDFEAYNHLKEESKLFECKEKALHYISIRNRSEHDLKQYLLKKGFDKTTISKVLLLFSKRGLINDYEYALQYIQSIREHKVVGNRAIEKKLFEKGIDKAIIKKALKKLEDKEPNLDIIYQLALKKYNQIKDKKNAKAKIASFLHQRGFSWEIIKKVLNKLWDGDDFFDGI